MMFFTDTHTHLYHESFIPRISELLEHASAKGIHRFVLPNIDEESIEAMLALHTMQPNKTRLLMGLHPCSVNENYQKSLEVIQSYLHHDGVIGVGEIGLDFYWDKTYIREQEDALKIQLTWALEKNMPVSLHCRNSIDRTIVLLREVLKENPPSPHFTGVFHCFTGSIEQAKSIIDLGFYLGIGGVVTFKNAGVAEVIKQVSMNHLVLETDAPYLAPVPHRGKPNLPEYLYVIAEKIAEIKNCSLQEVSEKTEHNASCIFNFNQ
ncbi:MAG: TatD family hydrolase [Bacteroidota bacterium]